MMNRYIATIFLSMFMSNAFSFDCPPIQLVKENKLNSARYIKYRCESGKHWYHYKWFMGSQAFQYNYSTWNLTFLGRIPGVNSIEALNIANGFIQSIAFDHPKPIMRGSHVYCNYFVSDQYVVAAESPPAR